MLKIHVQSEAVRRNLSLFKQIVHRSRKAEKERIKTYAGYVHKASGSMVFSLGKELSEKEWKPIIITVDLDKHEINVYEKQPTEKVFNCSELTPLAYRIMSETLGVLKQLSRQVYDLKELSYFELDPSMEAVESRDIIHLAWHQVSRAEAEKLLAGQPQGTYIFRKDEYAGVLEQELAAEHKTPIKCITLSYIDRKQCIRDYTIVKFHTRWLIYNDPTLTSASYGSIGELLEDFESNLAKPLLHPYFAETAKGA